jgi:hypothetical protein
MMLLNHYYDVLYDWQYLWAVNFNSTFLNEFSELNDMIKSIKVKVIDSCITVIVDRPVIRFHHQK